MKERSFSVSGCILFVPPPPPFEAPPSPYKHMANCSTTMYYLTSSKNDIDQFVHPRILLSGTVAISILIWGWRWHGYTINTIRHVLYCVKLWIYVTMLYTYEIQKDKIKISPVSLAGEGQTCRHQLLASANIFCTFSFFLCRDYWVPGKHFASPQANKR